MADVQQDFFTLLGMPTKADHPTATPPPATAKQLGWDALPTFNADTFYADYRPTLRNVVDYAANYFNEESQRYEPLIGETETLCTAFVSYVCAQMGVIIRSYPGTGKTATANPIFDMIPDGKKYRILNLSGKGIWYAVDDINAADYIYFGEWQKAAQNEDVVEIVKDWGEGRAATRERADITASASEGRDQTKKTNLPRKPILVTVASADGKDDESLNEQVLRRYPEVATDPSRTQTEAVIDMKGGLWDPMSDGYVLTMNAQDKAQFKHHIKMMIENAPKDVILPGGKYILRQTMPTDYPISRSMADIFKSVVRGVTRFHYYDRMTWTDKDGTIKLVASPADFWIARRIYGNLLLLNCLRVSAMGREIIEALPKLTARNGHGQPVATHNEKMTATEIRNALKSRGISLEKAKVNHELGMLSFNSYIDIDEESTPKRYYRSEVTTNLEQHLTPEVMREVLAEVKKAAALYDFGPEYIKRFCTDPCMVVDPLTGDNLNLSRDLPQLVSRAKTVEEVAAVPQQVKKFANPANEKGSGLYAFNNATA